MDLAAAAAYAAFAVMLANYSGQHNATPQHSEKNSKVKTEKSQMRVDVDVHGAECGLSGTAWASTINGMYFKSDPGGSYFQDPSNMIRLIISKRIKSLILSGQLTGLYPTADGRYFALHGGFRPSRVQKIFAQRHNSDATAASDGKPKKWTKDAIAKTIRENWGAGQLEREFAKHKALGTVVQPFGQQVLG